MFWDNGTKAMIDLLLKQFIDSKNYDMVLCILQWGQKIKPVVDANGKQISGSL